MYVLVYVTVVSTTSIRIHKGWWLIASHSPRVVVFFLGPFLQSYFQTISTPPWCAASPCAKTQLGYSWVAAKYHVTHEDMTHRDSFGEQKVSSIFKHNVSIFLEVCDSWKNFELNGSYCIFWLRLQCIRNLLQDDYLSTIEVRPVQGNTYT